MKLIKKNKLKDEVRILIQNAIFNGEFKPGERIIETRLATSIGVSQASVREALKELEHMGLIENKPYQGTYVKQATQKSLKDAYDARSLLESYAIESAAKKITHRQLGRLNKLLQKMLTTAAQGEVASFIKYDMEFHATIINCGGNEMIEKLWRLTQVSLWTYVATSLSKQSAVSLAERHIAIYDALENHDVENARKAMQGHMLGLRDELLENIENGMVSHLDI